MKKHITSILISILLLFTGFLLINNINEKTDRRIIDMHLHAIPVDAFPQHWDEWSGFERPDNDSIMMRHTIQKMERFGIVKGITSGSMELVEKYRKEAPDRIIPSLMVGANNTRESLQALADSFDTWHKIGKFDLIGEMATQYAGITPSDPALDSIFEFAAKHGVPIGIHMGIGPPGVAHDFAPDFDMNLANPFELEPVLKKYPALKIYIMHAGYPMLDATLALMYIYPQVYLEISEINWLIPKVEFHRYLRTLVEAGFGDRILFGSDQMLWPQSFEKAINSIESAEFLTEEQKDAIFYSNAARFLELKD